MNLLPLKINIYGVIFCLSFVFLSSSCKKNEEVSSKSNQTVISESEITTTSTSTSTTQSTYSLVTENNNRIKIGTFNIQNFGATKISRPSVVNILSKIAARYDLLFIQEISDTPDSSSDNTGPAIRSFLNTVRTLSKKDFQIKVSEKVGEGQAAEQYAAIFDSAKVQIKENFNYSDPNNKFSRDPFVIKATVNSENFYALTLHTPPLNARDEILSLNEVVTYLQDLDTDIIILGDLNADGNYFDEINDWSHFLPISNGFINIIGNALNTTVNENNDFTYDRIIISPSLKEKMVPNSENVFYFDDPALGGFDLSAVLVEGCEEQFLSCSATIVDAAKKISDHYPVEMDLMFELGTETPNETALLSNTSTGTNSINTSCDSDIDCGTSQYLTKGGYCYATKSDKKVRVANCCCIH